MNKRLEILEASLAKKEARLEAAFAKHFASVKETNGQPLNDKRNGQATLNRFAKEEQAIRTAQAEVDKTKAAIKKEQDKIAGVEHVSSFIPNEIMELVGAGVLKQWTKHPNIFFVDGVEFARICWDNKRKVLSCKYINKVTDKEQYAKIRDLFNPLSRKLNEQ